MDEFGSDLNSFINMGEKGSDTIVFQLGSHSLKFGLASQLTPFVIPMTIAHLKNKKGDGMEIDEEENENDYTDFNYMESDTFIAGVSALEQETLKKMVKLEQKLKIKTKSNLPKTYTNIKVYDSTNSETTIAERKNNDYLPNSSSILKRIVGMSNDLNDDIFDNNFKWTNTSEKPKILVGREALTLPDESDYIISKPIKYGYFNPEYQHQRVVDDITKIIEYCVVQVLQINKKSLANFQIVLLLPDLFIKTQVKSLVNIFLKTFGFKAIFLHLESVMSSFGAALQSACVLDIGADKVSVCCVDDGIILEDSLIRKNFGCDDLTKLFYLLLKRKNAKNFFPHDHIILSKSSNKTNQAYHYRVVEKLKESECEFPNLQNPTSQFIPKNSKIWLHKKNFATKIFNISLSEAAYLAPLALLNVELFGAVRKAKIPAVGFFNDIYGDLYADPEDTYEELILNLNAENANAPGGASRKEENALWNASASKGKKAQGQGQGQSANNPQFNFNGNNNENMEEDPEEEEDNKLANEDEEMPEEHLNTKKNTYEKMFKLMNLDDMICQSILSVENPELRKRLANSVLVVGGGSKFKGMIDYLEEKLFEKLTVLDNQIERVEIINYPTVDMKTISWIGGTIIPKLESSKDMWIPREKWLGEVERPEDYLLSSKDPINNLSNLTMNLNAENAIDFNNNNFGGINNANNSSAANIKYLNDVGGINTISVANGNQGNVSVVGNSNYNMSTNNAGNFNDNLSGFKQESVKEKEGVNKDKEKLRKKDRQLDGGPKLIREKCPFQW